MSESSNQPGPAKRLPVGGIEDFIFRDLNGLDEVKLPDEAIKFNPGHVYDRLKQGRGRLYDAKRKEWRRYPVMLSSPGEKGKRMAELMNAISATVSGCTKNRTARRAWYPRNIPVREGHEHRLAIMLIDSSVGDADTDEPQEWSDVFALTDFSCDDKESFDDILETIAHSASAIFLAQPDRRFVLSVSLRESMMTFAVFNRSGVFMSDVFDVHQEPERFIRIVAGMTFTDRDHIGLDRTMCLTDFDGPSEGYVEVDRKKYKILEILHVDDRIRGKSTVCLKVQRRRKVYVLKKYWGDARAGMTEVDIMTELEGVEGVSKLVAYEFTNSANGMTDKTRVDIDKLLEKQQILSSTASGVLKQMDVRQQIRMVTGPVGQDLLDFRSHAELMNAFILTLNGEYISKLLTLALDDFRVIAVERMYQRGIMHRDISLTNILFSAEENERHERAIFFIDFDLAINFHKFHADRQVVSDYTRPKLALYSLLIKSRERFRSFLSMCCIILAKAYSSENFTTN